MDNENNTRTGPRPFGLYYALWQQGLLTGTTLPDLSTFLQGVSAYRAHPFRRPTPEDQYQTIWQNDIARLRYCGGTGEPVLLIPSLINKPYIFDLLPHNSLRRTLQDAGFAVYLLDWGIPSPGHNRTVDDLMQNILHPILQQFQQPVHLAGYCMGGTLALAAAQLYPQYISKLVLLAAPWDFAPTRTHQWLQQNPLPLDYLLQYSPLIDVDVLQSVFAMLDPESTCKRLASFATETDPNRLERLVALEDWLADGIPLEPGICRTLLLDWHQNNQPLHHNWHVLNQPIVPENIQHPTLLISAARDNLVPPTSMAPLAETLPHVTWRNMPTGHIGLMVGRHAKNVFENVAQWLGTSYMSVHDTATHQTGTNI